MTGDQDSVGQKGRRKVVISAIAMLVRDISTWRQGWRVEDGRTPQRRSLAETADSVTNTARNDVLC